MHKIVIHFKNQAICTSVANLPELKQRLYISFAYTEILGDTTYNHYDCNGARK